MKKSIDETAGTTAGELMSIFSRMEWYHWVINIIYATMFASLYITALSYVANPWFDESTMSFLRVWGFLSVIIVFGNLAFFGKVGFIYPSLTDRNESTSKTK